jgi:hypothetical protein
MPKANQGYNLYVLKPSLVKEWHPTKNFKIKPYDVTPGSGKKVWWICQKGHEWQAVIYSRSLGSGCPHCDKLKPADNGSLVVSNSSLRLEWHPTANGELTLTNLTNAYPEKVWWICREGHEWKATIKVRILGEGCPVCDEGVLKKVLLHNVTSMNDFTFIRVPNSMSEIESLDTIFGVDFRKNKRFKNKATVRLQIPSSEHLFYAQMKDFSHDGMSVETSTSIRPGTKINIKLEKPLFISSQESYNSIIRWSKGLTDENGAIYTFGWGAQFIWP